MGRGRRRAMLQLLLLSLLAFLCEIAEGSHPCDGISNNYNDWIGSARNVDVVVVGGGIAGLSAMKTFMENQVPNAVLLEAQDYLGGRVKTYREGSILVEDGAEWINGGSSNRLYGLAERLGALTQPLPDAEYDWRLKTSNGNDANEAGYDVAVEIFNECEEDSVLRQYRNTGYGQCYSERFDKRYNNGLTSPTEKSAWKHYLQMESIPTDALKTSSPVCKVFWDKDPDGKALVVTATRESYLAYYVLVTASVGHLKERHLQLFDPPLPAGYQSNLNRIELGVADKVQLGWQEPWWDKAQSRPLDLHIIFNKFELPSEKSWLYGIMEFLSIHQQTKMIQAFVTGDKARQMENLSSDVVKQHLLEHLRRVTKQDVPEPTFFRRSKWGQNIWMRGSYNSYIPVQGDKAGLRSRAPLAQPITNSKNGKVIHWAGEHTSDTRYGTVDGAMDSGETAAFAIIDDMDSLA
ncbi:spermine oxidase-like isoform X2 [Macrobrachium nipponense]|uniref:spermine oxidase-like isoform X2 n=1 Tax=Macrobrachium nipponense TaxID=159736 RepID=UPI0030C81247